MSIEKLRVATVNAHEGRYIRSGGLQQLADCDVILMQEVQPGRDSLAWYLNLDANHKLVIASDAMRLAIAVRRGVEVGEVKKIPIDTASPVVNALRPRLQPSNRLVRRFRDRGFLSVEVGLSGLPVSCVTTHVNVAARPIKRAQHLKKTPDVLKQFGENIVFGGDMNHWPGPGYVDFAMQKKSDLERVPHGELTWLSELGDPKQRFIGRKLAQVGISIDAEMDAMFWRGRIGLNDASVLTGPSDHRVIRSDFIRI